MIERTCISRFVEKSRSAFFQKSSLRDVFTTIPQYRALVRKAYGSMPNNFVHNLGTSTMGLKLLATYEFLRYKKIPLPDANHVIHTVLPIKNCTASLLFKAGIVDIRDGEIVLADKQNE